MKKIHGICLSALLVCAMTITALGRDPFAIKTALSTTPGPETVCSIPLASGDILEFSARDLERRLSLSEGELGGITITALPTLSSGGLVLDGVAVEVYEFIERDALDRLCFVPGDNASTAVISFLPQSREAAATSLNIQILETPNKPPEIQDGSCETAQNVAVTGAVEAVDPEGGPVTLKLIDKPQKGSVTIDGLQYTYQPYKDMTGGDSFTVCAVDNYNAYSREATIHVQIEKAKNAFAYEDMRTNPSNYAALKLRETGILSGVQVGSTHLFQPDRQVTRGDYVMMLLSAAGLEESISPTVNTGLPNDSEIPSWMKPYVKAATDAGIISDRASFRWQEIPTRAEAVLMCSNAADISDVKDFSLQFPDLGEIPDWALPGYKDLAAYKMLDLHDGYAHPQAALTNSYAADLIWQLYKHKHR